MTACCRWCTNTKISNCTQGAHLAQCARSATIWASGRTRDPYCEILGASLLPLAQVLTSACVPLFGDPRERTGYVAIPPSVHGFIRAQIEHLFARMWHWGIVRNIWRGSSSELHEYVQVLLHL